MKRAQRGFASLLARQVVVGIAICVIGTPAFGQSNDLTRERLLTWFEAERQRAIDPEPLGNVRLDYEVHAYAIATAELLAQWKREVEGHPEHPKRQLIPVVERRLRDGPDVSLGSIWRPSEDMWRQSIEPSRPTPGVVKFGDKGQRGSRHWRLFEDTVVLEKPESSAVRSELAGLDHLLALFLYGGMHFAESQALELVRIDGNNWTIVTAGDNEWSSNYEGSWDVNLDRAFVRRVEVRPPSDWSVRVFEFGPYEMDPVLTRWVATRVDHRTGEGSEQTRMEYVLAGVHEVDEDRMAAVLRVPAIGREDAIRGVIASGSEQDVGEGVVRQIDEAGRVTATDRIDPVPPSSPVLRIVGVVAAVAIVGLLVWMRLRR